MYIQMYRHQTIRISLDFVIAMLFASVTGGGGGGMERGYLGI